MPFAIELTDGVPTRILGSTVQELYTALAAGRSSSLPLPGFLCEQLLDAARDGQLAANARPTLPAIPAPAPSPVANGTPASSAELLAPKPPGPEREYRRNRKDTRANHHRKPRQLKAGTKSESVRVWVAKHKPKGDAAKPSAISNAIFKATGEIISASHVSQVLRQLKAKP